jgi:hypothetical protein
MLILIICSTVLVFSGFIAFSYFTGLYEEWGWFGYAFTIFCIFTAVMQIISYSRRNGGF